MSKLTEYRDTVINFRQELDMSTRKRTVHIGGRIRSKRMELKLTQEMLGELLGISRGQVSNIESRGDSLSVKRLVLICDTLGTNPNYLLGYGS